MCNRFLSSKIDCLGRQGTMAWLASRLPSRLRKTGTRSQPTPRKEGRFDLHVVNTSRITEPPREFRATTIPPRNQFR